MTTTVNLRKILDRKQWEAIATETGASGSNGALAKSGLADQLVFRAMNAFSIYRPDEDAWLTGQLPALPSGFISAGGCGCHHPNGPTGTASAGSSTTLTTTTTVAVNLVGYTIRITAGTGAGQEKTIVSNTIGANSVITTAAWGTQPDNTSVYLLLTGRFWLFAGGGAVGLRYYDVATNAWSAALAAPTSITTEAALIATPGYYGQTGLGTGMASGTATSGSATTIVNSGKAWATNQWANYQVRITAGTGAGKIATITSNTGTTLTFPTVTTVLDNTSQYVIEGNDDFLYLLGGGAIALQRYSISGNSWSTLTPGVVRTNAPGTGTGSLATWANGCTDPLFTVENAIVNGRRIYAFNANAAAPVDYYDIPSNAWTNGVAVGRLSVGASNLATGGTSGTLIGDNWYIAIAGGSVANQMGQVLRLNIPRQTLDPWSALPFPSTTAIGGQRVFDAAYTDGGTTVRWIYLHSLNANQAWFRCMVI